jgi:phospholipid-translocating ATPase
MNTAENIGLSCNLINRDLKVFKICGFDSKEHEKNEQVILNFRKEFNLFAGGYEDPTEIPQFGILVDEKALLTILNDPMVTNIFLNVAIDAVSVICCRVSPKQKSQVVKMVKEFDRKTITLSVGDGGNDVPMITEAHIGKKL